MESPFNPPSEVSFENQNRESEWQDMNEENLQDCIEFLEKDSFQELFANYEYDEDYQPISKINLRNHYNNSHYPRAVNTLCGNPMFEQNSVTNNAFCSFKTSVATDNGDG